MATENDFDQLQTLDDVQLCGYLADRIRSERKKRGLSQAKFATLAGVSLRTYIRFEQHGSGTLETFVRAFKALGNVRNLYLLFPQALPENRGLSLQIERLAAFRRAEEERSNSQ
ncbi:helix-turn-helix transcriptional regulator [Paraburkholderia sp. Ac-20340]|uniref:helix-turn-helix domain-containing protein n=1 Tax=Paraburkholderia sp. Ac-20340 TaxID=2703888 RepID=UPI0019820FA6|nr:helix-turn-helix transcriptional regulator [Paraburkholderia sp. Ac-20340]MBN3858698.1 helix-turn-helix transcriptional regulator [Paraburkholderia sp. Ac-20340]